MSIPGFDSKFLEYANDNQLRYIEAWLKHGSSSRAAKELGCNQATVVKAWTRVRKNAALRGYAPDHDIVHTAAPGMVIKGTSIRYNEDLEVEQYWNKTTREGRDPEEVVQLPDPKKTVKVSTLYDPEGRVTQQWVSEKPEDVAREQAWKAAAEEFARELPRLEPQPAPDGWLAQDYLNAFVIGDHHLGMLSWAKETGANWDIETGEELLRSSVDYLLRATPDAATALVAFLGDFMHYDSIKPETPKSKNALDADSRYPKMVRAAIRLMRYVIDQALLRHTTVNVIVEPGNHDPYSSIFLIESLRAIYENEPRLKLDTSPRRYHYFQFGDNLIGTHHGDGASLKDLPLIMAADVPELWGATRHRYIWTGHVHHSQKLSQKDFPGVEVESFRVLPPADAWHDEQGYRAKRDMKAIVLHKRHGESARHTVNPDMVK